MNQIKGLLAERSRELTVAERDKVSEGERIGEQMAFIVRKVDKALAKGKGAKGGKGKGEETKRMEEFKSEESSVPKVSCVHLASYLSQHPRLYSPPASAQPASAHPDVLLGNPGLQAV
jgi:hypothetical protein